MFHFELKFVTGVFLLSHVSESCSQSAELTSQNGALVWESNTSAAFQEITPRKDRTSQTSTQPLELARVWAFPFLSSVFVTRLLWGEPPGRDQPLVCIPRSRCPQPAHPYSHCWPGASMQSCWHCDPELALPFTLLFLFLLQTETRIYGCSWAPTASIRRRGHPKFGGLLISFFLHELVKAN